MAKLPKLKSLFHETCNSSSQLSYVKTAQSEIYDLEISSSSIVHETLKEDAQSLSIEQGLPLIAKLAFNGNLNKIIFLADVELL